MSFKKKKLNPLSTIRESKKSGGVKEEKKRKSAGGDKEKERAAANDSFKSREFIETSEESSSDTDRKSKSKRKKVRNNKTPRPNTDPLSDSSSVWSSLFTTTFARLKLAGFD